LVHIDITYSVETFNNERRVRPSAASWRASRMKLRLILAAGLRGGGTGRNQFGQAAARSTP